MPNFTQRIVNNFIKGLITEAGELNFPENASVDELNCELFRDGSRRRRKALEVESGDSSTFLISSGSTVSFGEWENVGNNSNTNYLVIQVGPNLYFYNKNSAPYSSQEVSGTIDLSNHQISGGNVATTKCSYASILGRLVVVSSAINPIYVEEDSGVFTVSEIDCYVRDFEWLGDRSTYTSEEATPSQNRKYDTLNCGWTTTDFIPAPDTIFTGTSASTDNALGVYLSSESAYPPQTHPWYSGKNASGVFSAAEWKKVYSGSSILGNGHFIYNLWDMDRSATSGVPNLSSQQETTRFQTVAVFSERVFYAGLTSKQNGGKVYFSGTLSDIRDTGKFYQVNDPTSEVISDLLDTDGGVISISDAVNIKKLYAFRNSVFVFAENGVWQITGVDNAFKSTAYSVGKVTNVGILNPESFVSAEGIPFWWSRHGIHTLSFDEFGNASEQNLSVSSVQTFWNNIDTLSKENSVGGYDRVNKRIYWLYPTSGSGNTLKKNELLILDIPLQAFYPWTISDKAVDTDYVVGMQFYAGLGSQPSEYNVVTDASDNVVTTSGDNVVSEQENPLANSSISVAFFVRDSITTKMKFAFFSGSSFLDWGSADYTSYAETGYDFVGDLVLQKTAPYIVVYTRETETGWEGNETDGYTPVNDSSLLVSAYWDFNKNPSSTPQQAYRRKPLILADSSNLDSFNSKQSVVSTRLKARGRGRSLYIKFESETGKDFIYLGHGLVADIAGRY